MTYCQIIEQIKRNNYRIINEYDIDNNYLYSKGAVMVCTRPNCKLENKDCFKCKYFENVIVYEYESYYDNN